MTPSERAARASVFRGALEDGIISETLDEIEDQFTGQWKTCFDALERDNLWRTVMIVRLLKQKMGSIADGRMDSGDVSAIRRVK